MSSSLRLDSWTTAFLPCFMRGTTTMFDAVRWLSQVCEVITEPSDEAPRPTRIEVQAAASPTAAAARR